MQLYVQRLAEGLVARGHRVTILTSRHVPELPREETLDGVSIVRVPTLNVRISRGRIMPAFPAVFRRLAALHDVVSVHAPMLECGLVGYLARAQGIAVIPTHHGDLVLPDGALNRAITAIMQASFNRVARAAPRIVAYSADYAANSYYLRPFAEKVEVIPPPVIAPEPDPERAAELRREWSPVGGPLIGFAGRVVREKRPDLLLRALDVVSLSYPEARVVFAGEHQIAYEDTWDKIGPLVERHRDRLVFLGVSHDMQFMSDYYAACDVLALPSDTECFGLVQVEAMLCGTPVVVADTPGARVPVTATGMGRVIPRGDWRALGEALVEVIAKPDRYRKPRKRSPGPSRSTTRSTLMSACSGNTRAAMVDQALIAAMTRNEADTAFVKRVATIFEWIDPKDDQTILDCACGRGFYLKMFRRASRCRLVGVEYDPEILAKATRIVGASPDIALVNASIYDLPFRDESFDAVILSEILEHLDSDVEGLREVFRVCRPGAVVAITVPNANYPFWWDPINKTGERLFGRAIRTGPLAGIWANHVRLYTAGELRDAVCSAGFSIAEERAFTHHSFPFIHNLVYGLGKPLLKSGLMPRSLADAADRSAFDAPEPSRYNPIRVAISVLRWFDRRNVMNEPPGRATVNLCVKAVKPSSG